MTKTPINPAEASRRGMLFPALLAALLMPASCNESDDEGPVPEPRVVTSLNITVTGEKVQAPTGNIYLFHCEDAGLEHAVGREADRSLMPDGRKAPLVDVSHQYLPVVRYEKSGEEVTIHPVSAYGKRSDGNLDNHSSVRYSQMHFDIAGLSSEYGTVKKGSVVLVVIVLDDQASHTWVAHPLELRRNYVIHVALPDHKTSTYVPSSDLGVKWWQVEGEE